MTEKELAVTIAGLLIEKDWADINPKEFQRAMKASGDAMDFFPVAKQHPTGAALVILISYLDDMTLSASRIQTQMALKVSSPADSRLLTEIAFFSGQEQGLYGVSDLTLRAALRSIGWEESALQKILGLSPKQPK